MPDDESFGRPQKGLGVDIPVAILSRADACISTRSPPPGSQGSKKRLATCGPRRARHEADGCYEGLATQPGHVAFPIGPRISEDVLLTPRRRSWRCTRRCAD